MPSPISSLPFKPWLSLGSGHTGILTVPHQPGRLEPSGRWPLSSCFTCATALLKYHFSQRSQATPLTHPTLPVCSQEHLSLDVSLQLSVFNFCTALEKSA